MTLEAISLKFLEKEARSFKVKLGVFLLLIQDNKILLLRRDTERVSKFGNLTRRLLKIFVWSE